MADQDLNEANARFRQQMEQLHGPGPHRPQDQLSGAGRSMIAQMNSRAISEEELTRLRAVEAAARDLVKNYFGDAKGDGDVQAQYEMEFAIALRTALGDELREK